MADKKGKDGEDSLFKEIGEMAEVTAAKKVVDDAAPSEGGVAAAGAGGEAADDGDDEDRPSLLPGQVAPEDLEHYAMNQVRVFRPPLHL